MIYCEYGADDKFIDVTHIVLSLFMTNNVVHFESGIKEFNKYFTDPIDGVEKTLMIRTMNFVYTISENELNDIVIDLIDECKCNYKRYLHHNLKSVHYAKEIVTNLNKNHFSLSIINHSDDINITIVMTAYNRSVQTYFTLRTIANSINKTIQVIIIEDSTTDLLSFDELIKYDLCIYHIKIKNKFWFNPCINYNLGFKFIKGNKVIIQNAEVCHIGDIIDYIDKNLCDNQYFVFDVATLPDMDTNHRLYKEDVSFDNYDNFSQLFGNWYQHHDNYSRQLHFLTAITKITFDIIMGFDYDFCMGSWYDDDELIFRIKSSGIDAVNIPYDVKKIMGIHQWHMPSDNDWDKDVIKNSELLDAKKHYFDKHKRFFYLTDYNLDDAYNKIDELFE